MKTAPSARRRVAVTSKPIVTIIGKGLFGTYFSRMLVQAGYDCGAFDLLDSHTGILRLQESNLVIFAVPIRSMEEVAKLYAPLIPDNCIVMDVCSVKMWPADVLGRVFRRRDVHLVATHPLFGPQSAPVNCEGQVMAVCPLRISSRAMTQTVNPLIGRLGIEAISCTPDEHDRQVAESQALNHFLGRAAEHYEMKQVAMSTKTHRLFMEVFKIISGNRMDLFLDMFAFNPHALPALKRFRESFDVVMGRVEEAIAASPASARIQRLRR